MKSLYENIKGFNLDSHLTFYWPKRIDAASEFKIRGNLWRNVKVDVCTSIVRWVLEAEEYE